MKTMREGGSFLWPFSEGFWRERYRRKEFLFFKRKPLMLAAFKWSYFNLFESILKRIQENIFVQLVNKEQDSLSIDTRRTQP